MYPQISSENKVHLVSHSMGGMDCRLLTHLLNYGHQAEIDATPEGETVSELFTGGHDWIGKQRDKHIAVSAQLLCQAHALIESKPIMLLSTFSCPS